MKIYSLLFGFVFLFARAEEPSTSKDSTQLVDSIATVLRNHSKNGGIIELIGCMVSTTDIQKSVFPDVNSGLRALSGNAPLVWKKKRDSYLIEVRSMTQSTVMTVQLPALEIPDKGLLAASDTLFRQEAILRQTERLHLRSYDRSTGFASLPLSKTNSAQTLKLPAGTMSDDLNLIASRYEAIWSYRQSYCGGKRSSTFSWLQK